MDTLIIKLTLSMLAGIIISAILHIFFSRRFFFSEKLLSSITALTLSAVITIPPLVFFFWTDDDLLYNLSWFNYILPLLGSLLILLASFSQDIKKVILTTAIVSLLAVYLSGITIDFYDKFPAWSNMLLTALALCVFSCAFYCVSGLPRFILSQGMTITIGVLSLAFLGLAPAVLSISSAALLGIFYITYIRCTTQPIGQYCTPVLGYITGWIGLVSYPEYLLPCFFIFAMYYMAEASLSALRKISGIYKYQDLPYNTSLYQALKESNSPQLVLRLIWTTSILLIILGVFQINSRNSFSIPVFALILCIWQQYRTINWEKPDQTLRETNREVINSIKKSFNSLFEQDDDQHPKED